MLGKIFYSLLLENVDPQLGLRGAKEIDICYNYPYDCLTSKEVLKRYNNIISESLFSAVKRICGENVTLRIKGYLEPEVLAKLFPRAGAAGSQNILLIESFATKFILYTLRNNNGNIVIDEAKTSVSFRRNSNLLEGIREVVAQYYAKYQEQYDKWLLFALEPVEKEDYIMFQNEATSASNDIQLYVGEEKMSVALAKGALICALEEGEKAIVLDDNRKVLRNDEYERYRDAYLSLENIREYVVRDMEYYQEISNEAKATILDNCWKDVLNYFKKYKG